MARAFSLAVLWPRSHEVEESLFGFRVLCHDEARRPEDASLARIIQEMAKLAKKLEAPESDLKLFGIAANETQFSSAIDKIKAAIPSALRIDGHNPLTLLHDALSDGLHARSDEECLEYAREIRLVLTELAERMAQVLKDSELKNAVSKLLARAASTKKVPPPAAETDGVAPEPSK